MRLGLFFKEGRRRKLSPLWSRIVGVLVVLFAAVELYGAPFGFIDSFILPLSSQSSLSTTLK